MPDSEVATLSWLIKELRRAERSQRSASLLLDGLGGLTLTWGTPAHAWLAESAWQAEMISSKEGMTAFSAIVDALAGDAQHQAHWDDDNLTIGTSLVGASLAALISLCETASGRHQKPSVTLPHEPHKTTSPRLSLDRFPICPVGNATILPTTQVVDVNWLDLLALVKASPVLVYYQSREAQAALLLQDGHLVDGLWISLEEEPLTGRQAMTALTNAKFGECTAMTIAAPCAWVLPMLWRIPVRWDTIPLECVDPGRCCRFLADLPGSTLCLIETDQDAFVIGLRDGWVHCLWSEADRTPRVDAQELLELWHSGGGLLTIHRAMEPISSLPVHAGVFVTEPQPDADAISPIPLSQLVESLTGDEAPPPLFAAADPGPIEELTPEFADAINDALPGPEDSSSRFSPTTVTSPPISELPLTDTEDVQPLSDEPLTPSTEPSDWDNPLAPKAKLDDLLNESTAPSTLAQAAVGVFPDSALDQIRQLFISHQVDSELQQVLLESLFTRPCDHQTATWLCLELRRRNPPLALSLEAPLRRAFAICAA